MYEFIVLFLYLITYLPGKIWWDNIDPVISVPYSLVQLLLKKDTLSGSTSAFYCGKYSLNTVRWLLCGHLLRSVDSYSNSHSGLKKNTYYENSIKLCTSCVL